MATNRLINPYYNLAAIRNSDMFFGRARLLTKFYHALENRQSVSLVGPVGIGKSSFLYCSSQPEMQARFPVDLSHYIFVLLDLREYIYKTSEEFFHDICREIKRQSQRFNNLSLHSEDQGSNEFSNLLNQINEQGWYPILLMDAFDNIPLNTHFSPEFFTFLRAHATFGKISYVTASIAPLHEISYHDAPFDSPFANIFYSFRLGKLSEEEAFDLISIPAQRTKMPFTSEEIAWIRKAAGLHPFFIQRVCYFLFEEKQQLANEIVELQDIGEKVFDSLLPHFTEIWRHLTDAERTFLQDEVQRQSYEYQALPELSESALFRQFVLNRSEIEFRNMPISVNVQDIEDALSKMNDPIALGETNLQHLKAVTQRLNDNVYSSTAEKGKVIREVLNEALERLRGSGVQSDAAPEWRLYNILYYRYFRHQFPNSKVAAMLLFSTRQYFRVRNQAVEALLRVLLEIDL